MEKESLPTRKAYILGPLKMVCSTDMGSTAGLMGLSIEDSLREARGMVKVNILMLKTAVLLGEYGKMVF